MKNALYDHGYRTKWTDVYVEKRERRKTSVTDFHEHDFYEINLILSGNVTVFVDNRVMEGTSHKIVLVKPDTPHFVSCNPDIVYGSLFLVFTEEFIRCYDMRFSKLLSVFSERGAVYSLTTGQKEKCEEMIERIGRESNPIRKRLLIFYLLSFIEEFGGNADESIETVPDLVRDAIECINGCFSEKITAQELADRLKTGRTTLMTQFKKHTGKTVHEYVINCRLRNAIRLLSAGKTEYEAALSSGFSDSSALIQCFKRVLGTTPCAYLRNE